MDHKVSKDMISSGMTPSGQRSQSDLGRTQYGSAPSPNSLMDAYHSMYAKEKEETLDEGKIPAGLQAYLDKKKGKKGDDKKDEKKEDKKDMKEGMGLYANIHAKKKRGEKMRKKGDKGAPSSQDFANAAKTAKEDVDLFDFVKGKLIDEGIEESDAIKLMVNATEEQLQQIVEMDRMGGPAAVGAMLGAGAVLAKPVVNAVKSVTNFGKKLKKRTESRLNPSRSTTDSPTPPDSPTPLQK